MGDLIGDVFLALVLPLVMIWLPSQILGVWRGKKPVHPIFGLFIDKDAGIRMFEVTERNLPAFGTALFCLAGSVELVIIVRLLKPLGYSVLFDPLLTLAFLLGILGPLFGLMSGTIYWLGLPRSLIPPGQREETPSSTD